MKDNHTPGPWVVDYNDSIGHIKSIDPKGTGASPTICRYGVPYFSADTIRDQDAHNAKLIASACNSYHKNCGPYAVECAEGDLLGECLAFLEKLRAGHHHEDGHCARNPEESIASCEVVEMATAILAKRKGEK